MHDDIPASRVVDADTEDGSRQTPLHVAASSGDVDVIADLLSAGIDPNARDVNGRTPLHIAARHGHVDTIAVLIDSGAIRDAKAEPYGETPLYAAAGGGKCC